MIFKSKMLDKNWCYASDFYMLRKSSDFPIPLGRLLIKIMPVFK